MDLPKIVRLRVADRRGRRNHSDEETANKKRKERGSSDLRRAIRDEMICGDQFI